MIERTSSRRSPDGAAVVRLSAAAVSALECGGLELEEETETPLTTLKAAWDGGRRLTVTAENREAVIEGLVALANSESESVGVGGGSRAAWRALTALAGTLRRA